MARPISSGDSLARTYFRIQEYPFHVSLGEGVLKWRDGAVGLKETLFRRIAASFALFGSGLAGLIEVITSLALTVISAPLELAGYQFSRHFFKRASFSAIASYLFFTRFQCNNVYKARLLSASGS